LGADVVKINLPKLDNLANLPKPYNELHDDEAAAVRRVVESAGKTLVLFSGGSKLGDDDLVAKAHLCMAAGATGLIFGRNMWQRPMDEALAMTARIKAEVMSQYPREL
jgi:class I fructose-bisphosphate aldolase